MTMMPHQARTIKGDTGYIIEDGRSLEEWIRFNLCDGRAQMKYERNVAERMRDYDTYERDFIGLRSQP